MPPFRIMKMSLFFLFQIHIMDKSYIIAFWSPIQTLHPQFCLDYFIPLLQKFWWYSMHWFSVPPGSTYHAPATTGRPCCNRSACWFLLIFILFSVNTGFSFSNVCYAILDYFPCLQQETDHLCRQYLPSRNSLFWDSHTMLIFWKHCGAESLFSGIVSQSRLLFPQRKTSVFFSQN